MSDFLVIIDPGNGGTDPVTGLYVTPGASSPEWPGIPQVLGGVQNRDIAQRLAALLRQRGIPHTFTVHPGQWQDTPMEERARIANHFSVAYPQAILVSIHANARPGTEGKGLGVRCNLQNMQSRWVAASLQRALSAALPELNNRGLVDGTCSILNMATMPGALCEIGSLSSKEDVKAMRTASFRQRAAEGILEAIEAIAPEAYKPQRRRLLPLLLAGAAIAAIATLVAML